MLVGQRASNLAFTFPLSPWSLESGISPSADAGAQLPIFQSSVTQVQKRSPGR